MASVAVVTEEKLVGEYTTNFKKHPFADIIAYDGHIIEDDRYADSGDGCHCGFRMAGFFYRLKNRLRNSQGTWPGIKYSDYQRAYGGASLIICLEQSSGVPTDGCPAEIRRIQDYMFLRMIR